MNIVHNYKRILEDIFQKSVNLKPSGITNNCIGALASSEFSVFTQNFLDRLVRLKDYYNQDANAINNIINTAKTIGQVEGYKWAGTYSELVALDYWIFFKDVPSVKYIVKEDAENFHDSVARSLG